jgi:PPOX class probable F420-dependent enzyme
MTARDEIARSRYVSLTTYRRDGTPVATPVWQAPHDGELFIVSAAGAGKVKRLRHNSTVQVAVCDLRGRVAAGAPTASGTARLLSETETVSAREFIARKYLLSRIGNGLARLLRLRREPVIGIAIRL